MTDTPDNPYGPVPTEADYLAAQKRYDELSPDQHQNPDESVLADVAAINAWNYAQRPDEESGGHPGDTLAP